MTTQSLAQPQDNNKRPMHKAYQYKGFGIDIQIAGEWRNDMDGAYFYPTEIELIIFNPDGAIVCHKIDTGNWMLEDADAFAEEWIDMQGGQS